MMTAAVRKRMQIIVELVVVSSVCCGFVGALGLNELKEI